MGQIPRSARAELIVVAVRDTFQEPRRCEPASPASPPSVAPPTRVEPSRRGSSSRSARRLAGRVSAGASGAWRGHARGDWPRRGEAGAELARWRQLYARFVTARQGADLS